MGSCHSLKLRLFVNVKREILRRGAPMVPLLATFLTKELPIRRLAPTPAMSGIGCWYDTETMDLLAQIRDPSAAQALLAVLTGDGKKPALGHGYAAEQALETLTYCRFYKSNGSSNAAYGVSISYLGADRAQPSNAQDTDFEAVATLYRQWLAGEGKDAAQWLPLARRRAHLLLASDDPILINDAALFLTYSGVYSNFYSIAGQEDARHDDTPEATLKRLEEIAAQVEQDGEEVVYDNVTRPKYLYKNRPVPGEIGDLARFAPLYQKLLQPRALSDVSRNK